MPARETHISVTEITVRTGRTKAFRFDLDGTQVTIPIDETVFTNYQNQFYRQNPTPAQRKKFATLMALVRSAYTQGLADGVEK